MFLDKKCLAVSDISFKKLSPKAEIRSPKMFHTNWRSSRSGPRWSLRSLLWFWGHSLIESMILWTVFSPYWLHLWPLALNGDACSLYEVQTVSYNRYFCSMSTIYLCMYSLNFNELIALLWIFICDEHVCDEVKGLAESGDDQLNKEGSAGL